MRGEGDKTRPARGEPGGAIIGLGVRREAQLKCVYTNARSMGNKQEELEAIVQQASYDLVAITETWWDHSHDWSAAMDGYKLFRKDRQGRRGTGVALCVKECFEVTELMTGLRSREEPTRQTSWWASVIDRQTRMKRQMSCSMSSWRKLRDLQPLSSWGTSTFLTYAGNTI